MAYSRTWEAGLESSEIVLHVPHSSRVVPPDIRDRLSLEEAELAMELLRMTDHFTDELFCASSRRSDMTAVVFPVSRLVVDPERFDDDGIEPMASIGMGVIYTRTSAGQSLRAKPVGDERALLLERYYRPHHRRLEAAVQTALRSFGRCLVIDCHSFPSTPLPYEVDQEPNRPDICLGTDEYHTPDELLIAAKAACDLEGLSVTVNRPFAGALVPMAFYRRDRRVSALMIEVNRKLYMNEHAGEKSTGFRDVQAKLTRIIRATATSCADQGSAPLRKGP